MFVVKCCIFLFYRFVERSLMFFFLFHVYFFTFFFSFSYVGLSFYTFYFICMCIICLRVVWGNYHGVAPPFSIFLGSYDLQKNSRYTVMKLPSQPMKVCFTCAQLPSMTI